MPRRKNGPPKRNTSGMGSIYHRQDGYWCAMLTLDDGRRKALYGHTEDEVRQKLIKALKEKQDGTLLTEKAPTLSDFVDHWLEDVAEPKLKASTYVRYVAALDCHVLPTLGKVRLDKLTPQHLNRLYRDKLAAGLAPRHVGHLHRVLHVALKTAVRWGYIIRNVCDLVDPPRVSKTEQQAFTPEQARQFLAAIEGDPMQAYYVVALTTGMRSGELRALRWEDADLEAGTITVHRSLRRVYRLGWVESEPKTRSGWRTIPLIRPAVDALKAHRAKQAETRLQMGPLWEDHGRVFTNNIGKPLEDTNIAQRSLRPLLAQAGLPQMRPHDLRHSCATVLKALGADLQVISSILGHSSIRITADLYTHVLSDSTKQAVERLNRLFKTP